MSQHEFQVCEPCGSVVGPFTRDGVPYTQRGSCPAHAAPAGEPKWPRYDFNEHAALCRCCGRGPIESGSRYSVWFCPDCKEQVGLLHGRHGRCIIPIGPHSFHWGFMLKGSEVDDPIAVEIFLSAVKAVGSVRDLLDEWRHPVVRRNLREIGVDEGGTISLARYTELVQERIDPDERFRGLCAFLEEAGRQAAGRAAR